VITVRTVAEARAWALARRAAGTSVALVPTMGALHAGHLSLLRHARRASGAVVLSVFVNPTQFGPGEDFARYPRDPERDGALAAEAGADLFFAPSVEEMYPGGTEVMVDVGRLGAVWEGAARPGHFRGVATVVAKLLHATMPDVAVFGQKDAQQVVVVRHLVAALLWPVRILCAPTVRAEDGLALSSRNAYLEAGERAAAPALAAAIAAGAAAVAAGERRPKAVEAVVAEALAREPRLRPDYVAAVDAARLERPPLLQGRVLLLAAARAGRTRLLDNACLEVGPDACRAALP
jgi:pantoate--beta-alanine ligase